MVRSGIGRVPLCHVPTIGEHAQHGEVLSEFRATQLMVAVIHFVLVPFWPGRSAPGGDYSLLLVLGDCPGSV